MALNQTGIKKESFMSEKQIWIPSAPHYAVGIVVDQSAGTEDTKTGKTIVKAGTPLTGSLFNRLTPFTKATASGTPAVSNAIGILQHDVDVTVSDGNGDLLLIGAINVSRVDTTTQALITDAVKAALPTIKFIKD